MKKIINQRRYDTSTSTLMGERETGSGFQYIREKLYQKRNGEFFLHGFGGPSTKYAVSIEQNTWSEGEELIPLSPESAKQWAEDYLDAEKVSEIFQISEDAENDKKFVGFSISQNAIVRLALLAAERKTSKSQVVEDLILNA